MDVLGLYYQIQITLGSANVEIGLAF